MTAYFIFEFRSNTQSKQVQSSLTPIWNRPGYGEINVSPWKAHGTLLCEAFYYYPDDLDCKNRIEEMLEYIFSIAIDGRVYYYRFIEVTSWWYAKSKQKITIDALFCKYYPTMGGYCIRYELKRSKSNPR